MDLNRLKESILKDGKVKEEYKNMDFQYQIINELIKLRSKYNMTIEDFAIFCEVDVNLLHDMELGRILPSIDIIQRIVNHTKNKIQFKII